jgi:hypothetical protein
LTEWPEEPGLRFLFYWLLREEDLCPGADRCPWTTERDTRCATCAGARLERALDTSAGIALRAALDLDFALSKHIHISLDDMTVEEFRLLKMIQFERGRRDKEKQG